MRMPTMWYANLALEKTFLLSDSSTIVLHLTGYNITDNMITARVVQSCRQAPLRSQVDDRRQSWPHLPGRHPLLLPVSSSSN